MQLANKFSEFATAFKSVYLGPFLNQWATGETELELGIIVAQWLAQLSALSLSLFLLIRVANRVPSKLATLQQRMLHNIDSPFLSKAFARILSLLKTNGAWLIILSGAWLLFSLTPEGAYIFQLVGFCGTLIAMVRLTSVTVDWLMYRAATKGGQYFSPAMIEQLEGRAFVFAWVLVGTWTPVWIISHINSLVTTLTASALALILSWYYFFRIVAANNDAIDKFVVSQLSFTAWFVSEKKTWKQSFARAVLWPIFVGVAQLLDMLHSINQRLMVFDAYRSFAVRLLRIRLDTKDDGDAEDSEQTEPDHSYSTWLMREMDLTNDWIASQNDEYLVAPIKKWHNDLSDENVMYMLGAPGSGKTTLARHFASQWKDCPVHFLDISAKLLRSEDWFSILQTELNVADCGSVAELVKADQDLPKQIVIVDDAHNLFLADVGKLEAYKTFIQCLNAQIENIFWLVLMNTSSWTYLDCIFSRELRISHTFYMQKWKPTDIRTLLLSRHKGSKRRLKYNDMLLSAVAGNEYSNVRTADSRVFNLIWEQSQGNPLVAIHLWLSAARVQGRNVEIGVPQKPETSVLKSLNDDLCFIYAAIVLHDSMSTFEIVSATNFPGAIVRHAIKQGLNMGLLTSSETKRYSIEPVWYSSLCQYLVGKNMLWRR